MRIGFLTPEYPHEKVHLAAGIGTSVGNLATALINENVAVSVFVFGQKTDEVFVADGIKIHLIALKKYRFFGWYKYRKHLQNYINSATLSENIDLIEAPDWTGMTAFMNLKAPLVIRFHGTDAYFCHLENRKQKTKNFIFEKLGILKATAYVAPTQFAGKITKHIFKLKKNVATIHNGLSLAHFENPHPEQFTKGLILYIGTIIRKKGVLELPEIFEKVLADFPEAQLVLIGGDAFDIKTQSTSTWEMMLDKMSENVKSRTNYLGKVPYHQIREYIKKANVCVFPTFAETLGMVTIESMAMQKPVVNSNIGWSEELIDDGVNGFLVHPQDHILYADRIVNLLSNDNLCLNIGKAAREKVERDFDIAQLARQNKAFYERIIKEKN